MKPTETFHRTGRRSELNLANANPAASRGTRYVFAEGGFATPRCSHQDHQNRLSFCF